VFFVIIGVAVIFVAVVGVLNPILNQANISASQTAVLAAPTLTYQALRANVTTIKMIYGTEKELWLRDAVQQFQAKNPDVFVDLDGEGSMDAYQVLSQLTPTSTSVGKLSSARDNDIPAVWSPASQIQVNLLNGANQMNNQSFATSCKNLVLSPLVIMAWEDRATAFTKKYTDGITFDNLYAALDPKGDVQDNWAKLGGNANWGLIKLGHTDPRKSNSGIMMLVAMANNKYKVTKPVNGGQVADPTFQEYIQVIETGLSQPLISSTGTFTNDVISKGPAAYDIVVAYEALAIENFENARGRQGQTLKVFYPPFNLYSDHPMCMIDHPGISGKQKEAAQRLQDFLLSSDIQKLALKYGFRPSDTSIPIFSTDVNSQTDFDKYKTLGISNDIGQLITVPDGPTINNLLSVWQKNAPN
jgi:hypothetical protein